MKLNVLAFGLAFGLIWGFGLFLITWWIIALDGPSENVPLIGQLYRGYAFTPVGSLIGFLWALPDGFIGGAIFAWLYNLIASRLNSNREPSAESPG